MKVRYSAAEERTIEGRFCPDLLGDFSLLMVAPGQSSPSASSASGSTSSSSPSAELQQLAADCVRDFDGLRAPLTDADRARRKPEALSAPQRDYLERWGYPYVMDQFRFHMTLTGRLPEPQRAALLAQLQQRFAELALDHCAIDRIVLCQQQDRAPFRVIGEFQLRSA